MSDAAWKSPLPEGFDVHQYRVWKPGTSVHLLASNLVDRAWRGRGVRLFWWPCGTSVIATVGTRLDRELLAHSPHALFATYVHGALMLDVLADLRWARRSTQ